LLILSATEPDLADRRTTLVSVASPEPLPATTLALACAVCARKMTAAPSNLNPTAAYRFG
jgi:hypothetical protein